MIFALALKTGLRKGEIRGLKWDAADLRRKALSIKRIYCDTEGKVLERTKGKRDHLVPMNEALSAVLQVAFNTKQGEYVAKDFNWMHPHRLMRKICAEAKVPEIRFHDLRHTFASLLVMSGRPIYEVQKLLGHASISTTEQYAHLAPNFLQEAADGLKV